MVCIGPTLGALVSLFIGESNNIIVDALLLRLFQLLRCSLSVDCLGLCHGCVCYGCRNKDQSSYFSALFILKLLLEINYILASFKPTDDVCLSLSKMFAFKELLTGFPEETLSYIWDKIIRNS